MIEQHIEPWIAVVAVLIGVLGSARLTRLVTADKFPPVVRLRIWWDTVTHDGPWSLLVHCPWCFAPYVVAPNLAWAVLSELHLSWWLFNGWLAGSYAASWIVFHDEDGGNDED